MKRLTIAALAIAALSAGLLAAASAGGDPKPDAEAIQGAWRVVLMERRGQRFEFQQTLGFRQIFEGDRVIVEDRGGEPHTARFTLDPAQSPHAIDIVSEDADAAGRALKGIYTLDRAKGELTICFGDTPDTRPAGFASSPDSDRRLLVFHRESPDSSPPPGPRP